MAFTALAASPYCLRYFVDLLGPGTQEIPQGATGVADDAAAGPLATLLSGASSNAAWNALAASSRLSVYATPGSTPVVAGYQFTQDGGGANVLAVTLLGAGNVVVELRFNHSAVR